MKVFVDDKELKAGATVTPLSLSFKNFGWGFPKVQRVKKVPGSSSEHFVQ